MEPYANLDDYAHMASLLPKKMQDKQNEVRVFMPKFGKINERKHRLHEVIRLSGINIQIDDDDNPMIIKVASLPGSRIQVYFLDNEEYFQRKSFLQDKDGTFFKDNDERMLFFDKGVIEIALKLGWVPDIIHCHGWMSSLVPLYARTQYKKEPVFKSAKFVQTVSQSKFEGAFGEDFLRKGHLKNYFQNEGNLLTQPSCTDLYKVGLDYADGIVKGNTALDEELETYLAATEKPVLDYIDPEDPQLAEKFQDFYDELGTKRKRS
jgi:starch synthase